MGTQSKETERIHFIDILRGITLLGIVMVHFTEQYYAGMPPEKATHLNSHFLPDQLVQGLISFFVTGKFYMIFSFLFGLSFFIQSSKSESNTTFLFRFLWRLLILFAIGWIHHLHYRGDILTIYALLGVALLFFQWLPDKILLILAIVLIIDIPAFLTRGIEAITTEQSATSSPPNPFNADNTAAEKYFNALKSGLYINIIKANIPEFKSKMEFQIIFGRIYITFGLFLLGLYAGRKKLFQNISDYLPQIKRLRNKALWTLPILVLFAVTIFGGAQLLKITMPQSVQWMIGGLVYDIFNATLAIFYVCVIALLYQKDKWAHRFHYFYEVGRMGLTTYLMQTLLGIFIFFGIGFNLLDEIGASICFTIGITWFIIQIIFAKWWLKRFNFGPVEWLWRTLTYLKWQPLSKEIKQRYSN